MPLPHIHNGRICTHDALGRPVSRNADTFGYNSRNEVVSASIAGGSPSPATATYAYDSIGNLLSHSNNAATNTYTANNLNQYTLCDSAALRELSYDADGNLLTNGAFTYAYDADNRLASVSSNGLTIATFSYDAQGHRVRKIVSHGGTEAQRFDYLYDGWLLVRETATGLSTDYVWGKDISGTIGEAGGVGGLLYEERGGDIYVPFYDNNGNITHYCDAQGNVVASYTYDAFGNTIAQSGPMAGIFSHRFSTKYFDTETGLYYYGYRYYSPELMRWMNRDPIGEDGGLNLYAFCRNNAIENIDVLGLYLWFVLYYDEARSGSNFQRAAETCRRNIEDKKSFSKNCDEVQIYSVRTKEDFMSVWNRLCQQSSQKSSSTTRYQVKGLFLYTLSGQGQLFMRGDTIYSPEIKELPKLNWAEDAEILCMGCNSGLEDTLGDSVAGSFYESQGVPSLGQSGASSFSSNPNKKSKWGVFLGGRDVFLWSFDETGRSRDPIRYPKDLEQGK